jgi:hypothetical protein
MQPVPAVWAASHQVRHHHHHRPQQRTPPHSLTNPGEEALRSLRLALTQPRQPRLSAYTRYTDAPFSSYAGGAAGAVQRPHWPKHLLVQYTWRPVVQVDTAGGLLLVLLAGACIYIASSMCELDEAPSRVLDSTHHCALVRSLGSALSEGWG